MSDIKRIIDERDMERLDELKKELQEGGYTCILSNGECSLKSRERGILPLLRWMQEGRDLHGFFAADKTVGKAAAMLYICMGIGAVYADILAESGREMLNAYNVHAEYGILTPHITNRAGDGICPMERTVMDISAPETGKRLLEQKVFSRRS